MLIVYNPHQAEHAGRQEMHRGRLVPCHETPDRFAHIKAELDRRGGHEWLVSGPAERSLLERVHSAPYLDFLAGCWGDWVARDPANAAIDILPSVWPGHGLRRDAEPAEFSARLGRYAFDNGSPIMAGTWAAALTGAGCAAAAARAAAGGKGPAFAFTRPPGHHAGREIFGGYCFLNNAALAAETLRGEGAARVAVLDVDYHHGNGTQDIFYGRDDVFTVSLHGDPRTEYPFYLGYADEKGEGAGEGFNLNIPLRRGTSVESWMDALHTAIDAVRRFGAEALVVALGVDSFEGDPISGFLLKSEDFPRVGRAIAALGLPTVFTMEGGYAVADLGINVANLLEGFAG